MEGISFTVTPPIYFGGEPLGWVAVALMILFPLFDARAALWFFVQLYMHLLPFGTYKQDHMPWTGAHNADGSSVAVRLTQFPMDCDSHCVWCNGFCHPFGSAGAFRPILPCLATWWSLHMAATEVDKVLSMHMRVDSYVVMATTICTLQQIGLPMPHIPTAVSFRLYRPTHDNASEVPAPIRLYSVMT